MTITSTGTWNLQRTTEPDGLGSAIRNITLDYQEVEVASLIGVSASMRAKQDHFRGR